MRKRWQAHMGRGEHIDNLQDWLKTNNCFLPDDMNESDWTSLAMCLGKEAREASGRESFVCLKKAYDGG